jgi:hypothetical protein
MCHFLGENLKNLYFFWGYWPQMNTAPANSAGAVLNIVSI